FLAAPTDTLLRVYGPAGELMPIEVPQPALQPNHEPVEVSFGPDGGMVFRASAQPAGPRHPRRRGDDAWSTLELSAWRLAGQWRPAYSRRFKPLHGHCSSRCGRWFAWAGHRGALSVVDLATGTPLGNFAAELNASANSIAFLDDGETIFV